MDEVQYIGEHLLPGRIGQFLIIFGFVTALLSAVSYFYATQHRDTPEQRSWKTLGRWSFILHGLSFLTVIGLIFYMMMNYMYEYKYVLEHVSDDLDFKYILSAFWEGQEGSFLLWMFWHIILGFIFLKNKSRWESPVMSILALIQLVIATMLLGVHIEIGEFVYRIGSSPMVLLRDTMNIPLFQNAEYVSLLKGNGLNPLLQNYWMTIHPPTLFLGFASVAMPFCFTIAGLWTGDHKGAMKSVLSWSLFSSGILGSGILMGGAWAYVALTFGGYWAWDPGENASLVPWLMLIGGLHTNYIAVNTDRSIKATYLFYILSFVLILYSTFLTRSGILGETSAHAFTEMGLEWQLVALVLIFLFLGIGVFIAKAKTIVEKEKEESIYSREFWLFIGSLVLFFSSAIITASTSLPVFNTIASYFSPGYIGKVINDPIPHYNKYQLWIAVFISVISAVTLFMRYNAKDKKQLSGKFLKHIAIAAVGGILLTVLYKYFLNLGNWQHHLLMFACGFSIIASLDYLFGILKGNLRLGASALSHFGFSVMIVGSLAAGLNERHVSNNTFIFGDLFTGEDANKYVKLLKNKPLFMNDQWVTYEGDTLVGHTRSYDISIASDKNGTDKYYVRPNVVYTNDFSKIAATNPATKMFLEKDLFTNIAALHPSLQDAQFAKEMQDTIEFNDYVLRKGTPLYLDSLKNYEVNLIGYSHFPTHPEYRISESELGIEAQIQVKDHMLDTVYKINPALGLKGNLIYTFPVKSNEMETVFKLDEKLFDQFYTPEQSLDYKDFIIQDRGIIQFNDVSIRLVGFSENIEHKQYIKEEKDIAVAALLEISAPGLNKSLAPVYIIRGNRPLSIKEYIPELGLHIRFSQIDPENGNFYFKVAQDKRDDLSLPLAIANNVDRTDYVIFEARIFPGINFFWLGSIVMLFGLFLALYQRNKSR